MSKAKTLTDMLNDAFNQSMLGPQQGQLAAAGPQDPFGQYWTSAGTTLDPAQILKILQGYTSGLSADEKKELDELNKIYQSEIKAAKLGVFKKLAPELRQYVINAVTWKESVEDINKATASKSERQVELENKESLSRGYGGASMGMSSFHSIDPSFKLDLSPPLPTDLSIEDLKQAHMEACLEEEMLNVED